MSLPATRMNLLACRDQMVLAVAGVDLLKSKREALIADFFRIADTVMDSREEMAKDLPIDYRGYVANDDLFYPVHSFQNN